MFGLMGQRALHGVWHKDWRSEAALEVDSVYDSILPLGLARPQNFAGELNL